MEEDERRTEYKLLEIELQKTKDELQRTTDELVLMKVRLQKYATYLGEVIDNSNNKPPVSS